MNKNKLIKIALLYQKERFITVFLTDFNTFLKKQNSDTCKIC